MDSYSLYLDEILPNGPFKYFCLAGVVIKEDNYVEKVIPSINKIKNEVFGDTTVILHEQEIRKPERGTVFEIFKDEEVRNKYWNSVVDFFATENFNVFSVSIHQDELERIYPGMRDKYFISLQVILENFVHFLLRVNGKGNIMVESRNPSQNEQLQFHFHNLKANGTLFYEQRILQSHLGTISFPLKADNIIGLQIADMIPNPLNRELSEMKQKVPEPIIEAIKQKSYDGGIDQQQRFGIKIIP